MRLLHWYIHTGGIKTGETQRKFFALSAWKESPLIIEEDRAVLQLTEKVNLIAENGVSDETYDRVLKFYGENNCRK